MATLTDPAAVSALLTGASGTEETPLRVYQYHRRDSARPRYAAFWRAEDDDIWTAPEVVDCVLLWADGALTPLGEAWVRWGEARRAVSRRTQET